MPGKIVSRAQQSFLAMHNPKVLHELSGGHIANGLPQHVRGGQQKKPGLMNKLFGGK